MMKYKGDMRCVFHHIPSPLFRTNQSCWLKSFSFHSLAKNVRATLFSMGIFNGVFFCFFFWLAPQPLRGDDVRLQKSFPIHNNNQRANAHACLSLLLFLPGNRSNIQICVLSHGFQTWFRSTNGPGYHVLAWNDIKDRNYVHRNVCANASDKEERTGGGGDGIQSTQVVGVSGCPAIVKYDENGMVWRAKTKWIECVRPVQLEYARQWTQQQQPKNWVTISYSLFFMSLFYWFRMIFVQLFKMGNVQILCAWIYI